MGHAALIKHAEKIKWWTDRFELSQHQVMPVIVETLGYMPPKTEDSLRALAADVDAAVGRRIGQGHMTASVPYGHRLHRLAEKVGLAQQVGNARLLLDYITRCAPVGVAVIS
jgi:hypothetical protein